MTLPKTTKYLNATAFGILLLTDAALPSWATTGNQHEEVFQGVARNARGEIAYIEEHRMIYQDGRPDRNETRYRDANGQEIAVLKSSFTHNPYVPNYSFEDRRFGRQDGAFVDGAWVKLYGRADQEGIFGELKSQAQMDYIPVRRWGGNQLYTMASIMAHNLTRELQMVARPKERGTTEKRAPLWCFDELKTLRHLIIQRAGRLTAPQKQLTLTLNGNEAVQREFFMFLDAFKKAA